MPKKRSEIFERLVMSFGNGRKHSNALKISYRRDNAGGGQEDQYFADDQHDDELSFVLSFLCFFSKQAC